MQFVIEHVKLMKFVEIRFRVSILVDLNSIDDDQHPCDETHHMMNVAFISHSNLKTRVGNN